MENKREIPSHFGCSVRHIGNFKKKLPYVKLGRIVRFNVANCEKAIKAFEVKSIGSFSEFQ